MINPPIAGETTTLIDSELVHLSKCPSPTDGPSLFGVIPGAGSTCVALQILRTVQRPCS
jgi:hypothetical protein